MSLRDFIRQTKMLIEHGLYVTRGTANGGVYERPLEAARLEERILFSASAMAPVAAELASAGDALTSALVSMGDDPSASSDSGVLSDGQFLDLIADAILPQSTLQPQSDSTTNGEDTTSTDDPATNITTDNENQRVELVFVDTGIANYETIVNDIRVASQPTRAIQVVLLDATQDGLKQINLYMSGMTQTVDTVHFITHGTDRALKLGSTWIDIGSLASHQTDIEQWRNVLTPNADLVFYGGDLVDSAEGQQLLKELSSVTNCAVVDGGSLSDLAEPFLSTSPNAYKARNVILVDRNLDDSDLLIDAARSGSVVFAYDGTSESALSVLDRVAQWAQQNQTEIQSLSILSHGISGGFELGNQWITTSSLISTADGWKQISQYFVEDADIYILGCNVGAENRQGQQLVDQLAILTRTDVFASSDITGVGGDWLLELGSAGNPPPENAVLANVFNVDQLKSANVSLAWYNANWNYRQTVTINESMVTGTSNLSNFAVLVSVTDPGLKTTANGGNVGQADGGDFVFTSSDGTTKLDYQIESYDATTGTLLAWVEVPTLSHNVNTSLYLYYGNAAAANQWNAAGTWETNYKGVWHLGSDYLDSTATSNDGTNSGSTNFATAKIGSGDNFDGISDYVSTTSSEAKTADDFTISLWFNADATNFSRTLIWQGVSTGNGFGDPGFGGHPEMNISLGSVNTAGTTFSNNLSFFLGRDAADSNAINISTAFTDTAGWHHVVVIVSNMSTSPTATMYLDGSSVGTDTGTTTETSRTSWNTDMRFGRPGAAERYYDGGLDEVRLATTTRTADWVLTEYNNQNNPGTYVTLTSEEGAPLITSNGGGATASVSVSENATGVTTVTAADPGAPPQTLVYSISGGVDAAKFTIDSGTGELTFVSAPNYESPTDSGANNVYEVIVQVSDGTLTDAQFIAVTVTNVNENPIAVADSYSGFYQGDTSASGAPGVLINDSDPDGDALTVSLVNGPAYATTFTLNADGSFSYLHDGSENFADIFVYSVSDGLGGTATAAVSIAITPVNDDPVLIDGGTESLSEGGTTTPFLGIGTVTDPDSPDFDGGELLATITSGMESGDVLALANVGGVTTSGTDVLVGGIAVGTVFGGAAGVPMIVTFNANATLARVQAVYESVALTSNVDVPVLGIRTISVTVTDGDGGTSNTATGIVDFDTAINDTPVVTPSAPLIVPEDTSGIISLFVTDPDAGSGSLKVTLNLSNASGTITLGSTTGLSFSVGDGTQDTSMSFTGTLTDLNNALSSITYSPTTGFNGADALQYAIDDQGNSGSGGAQTADGNVSITVDSENDAPALSGANNLTAIDEDDVFNNGTLVSDLISGQVTDPDPSAAYGIAVTAVNNSNGTWQYTINNGSNWLSFGGVSASTARLLTADAMTRVRFVPNANYNGTVNDGITFAAWDGTSGVAGSTANIAPTTYLDQFNTTSYLNSNGTGLWTSSWVETDNNGGGASSGLIRINSGVLEVKSDRSNDNVYRQVDLSSATSASVSFSYQNSIGVGDGDVVRFQVSGNGGASYTDLATFDSGTNTGSGTLSFDITSSISSNTRIRMIVTSVDQTKTVAFDDILITATSSLTGGTTAFSTATASSSLIVNSVNDEQVFVAGPGQNFAEGSTGNVVTTDTLLTTDVDNSDNELVYTLSILPAQGVLKLNGFTLGSGDTFTQAQVNAGQLTYDHDGTEGATDSFSFSVDDGLGADTGVLVNFQINGVNDNSPVITSNGAGPATGISVSENSTAVTTVQATDTDLPAELITYSIVSDVDSADAARFVIDSATGVLKFAANPDFESPTDSNGDNVYVVKVQASDGTNTDTQLISVTVTDVTSLLEVTTISDIDDSGLGTSYTIEQLHAAGGGADGEISLREAIVAANSTAGLDTITFNISGAGPHTISLAAALPEITQAIVIDGWSEPDFAGTPVIQLDGSAAPAGADGLWISSGGSTVRGLIISGFNDRGISLTGGGGNTIVGNRIGTNTDGTAADGNGTGIFISSSGNTIGGTTTATRNVISGNTAGNIAISGAFAVSNVISGNYIGTSEDGMSAIASAGNGITLSGGAVGNQIGGSGSAGNVISGFGNIGIEVTFGSHGNAIQGNLLGVNATASGVLTSGAVGITLNSVSNTLIGGTAAGEGNTFGGFANTAIWILGGGTSISVQGNFFGTDATQTASYANGTAVDIWNATSSTIGGTVAGAGNIIAHSTGSAIKVMSPSTGISILGNSLYSNSGIGIDLSADGVTVNDADDSDTGANRLSNFPVITMAARSGTTVRVEGTLKAEASTVYRIEIFANAVGLEHSSGYGAGQRYLGFVTVTTDAAGSATFSSDITAAVLVGETVSATATDAAGNTSEFGANRVIVMPVPVIDLDSDDSSGETGADFIASFVEDGSPVNVVDADAIAFDTDTSNLNKLTVTITNLIDGSNEILTADTSGTSLNASYVGGVLTITGTASESDYQQVLRTITYDNTSQNADTTTRILTITVEDGVFVSNTATSRIQILTSNDAPTIQANALTIAEGGTVIITAADLLSTDAEQSVAQLTYTISGVSGGRFEFVANAGVAITSFTQADINSGAVRFVHDGNEAAPSYDVTVSDGLLSNGPQSVLVTFTGANDAPVMNSATFSVVENSTLGTTVGFATSTDSDVGDTRNYSILSGNISGAFGINAGSGEIVVLNPAALDFETITSFSLTIQVSDAAGASSTAVVTINVTNVGDNSISALSDTDATNEIVAENSTNGANVGITALATDADAADSISYSLTDDAGGRFAIDSVTGVVTVANGAALDYETGTSHNITVRATSTDGSFSTRTFLIQLTDVNESGVSAISDMNASVNTVAENSSNGTTVGYTAFAADPDSTDAIFYTLDDNAGGRFAIDTFTGIVTVANGLLLDREAAAAHTIIVRATSTDGSIAVLSVDISLIDVNEFSISAPTDLDAAANTVAELSLQGTLTGITVSASDADATTNAITYSLDNSAGGRFQVDSVTGVITVGATASDYETATSYSVMARATSADGSSRTLLITINITDVNESGTSAVTDTDPAVNQVLENAVTGTLTGITAHATDPDGTDTITYSLDNNAGGRFQIDSVSGVVSVADGTLLDRELAASHSIIIRATSTDSSFSTQTFIVNLGDVDEFDVSAITDSNVSVDGVIENSANGTIVGITANAFDSDVSSNTITWSLDDNAGGRFQIGASTGIVTVANGALLDFETSANHTIIVRATSADTSSSTQTFLISLLDTNDAPPVITPGQQFNVSELAGVGTVFGTVAAVDPDGVGTLQGWTIVSGNTDGVFAINPTTGALRITNSAMLNFETTATYTLTLSVGDGTATSLPQTVLIRIMDGNEAPVSIVPTPLSIDENTAAGTIVGSVSASDVDAGDVLSYAIMGSITASPFAIDAATGVIRVADSSLLDFEARQSITLQIQVTDVGGLTATTSVVISLNDVNEIPSLINLAGGTVQENRGAGTFVGQLSAVDPDAGEVLTWTLVDDANGTFVVNSSTGRIDVAAGAVLNFEQMAAYGIAVDVTDSGGLTHQQTFTIRLLDVNDAPIAASDLIPGIQLTGIEVLTPGLLLNDFDEDGDALQAVLVSTTANGVLVLRADGSLLYSPNGVFSGIDTFVYYVTDGFANSAPVTVTINVAAAVGGSPGGSSGSSGETSDSTSVSSGGDTTTDTTDSSADGGDEITVVTTTQFFAAPAAPADRSDKVATPTAPVAEPITESGPSAANNENVAITGELIASVFVSDFFVNTRSERMKSVTSELAQAAVFGGMMLDTGVHNALVSLNLFTIDRLIQRVDEPTISEREELAGKVAVGSAAVVTTSLSVGYVIWILRGGSLLTTFMSALPAWQAFDPLPVLQSFHKATEEDDDTLLSIATRKTVDSLKKIRKS